MPDLPTAAIVVMGVSGSGKSTVAQALAQRLGWELVEADTFHPPASVEKMGKGIPLGDADRWPWLDAIASWIEKARAEGRPCIVACSALKRSYRERLARGAQDVRFVYLRGGFDTVAARMAGRAGHFMPQSLLNSQYKALEEPGADENPVVVSIDLTPGQIVEAVAGKLGLPLSHGNG